MWLRSSDPTRFTFDWGKERIPFRYRVAEDVLVLGLPGTHHDAMRGPAQREHGIELAERIAPDEEVQGVVMERGGTQPAQIDVGEPRENIPSALIHRLRREFPELPPRARRPLALSTCPVAPPVPDHE